MTFDQSVIFLILGGLFALLIWGRWRYDLVSFAALLIAVILGVVPSDQVFSGFGHPATVIIALVLIVSRGLTNSGAIELAASKLIDTSRKLSAHIGVMAAFSAALSGVMNNVAALALLMPIDIKAAQKSKRSPALSLMPLAFASILGGLVTLIGTPPNIIIAAYRGQVTGEPFKMFDFTPVGAISAIVGVMFIALIGWRLLPKARGEADASEDLRGLKDYVSELVVSETSPSIGRRVRELDDMSSDLDVAMLGLLRKGQRLPGLARNVKILAGDILIVHGGAEEIEAFSGAVGAGFAAKDTDSKSAEDDNGENPADETDLEMREVVVSPGAYVEGRAIGRLVSLRRNGVSLLGLSRQGQRSRERLAQKMVQAGDILLLLGPADGLDDVTQRLGCLPIAERGLQVIQRKFAGLAVGLFLAALVLASLGYIQLPIALGAVALAYVLFGVIPVRNLYASVEWSVVVLLGSLIPIGQALESSGGTGLIASGLLTVAGGYAPWVALTLLMVITMTVSDIMNNTATAVVAAPVAVEIAGRLEVSADPFLMAVAVAASCAFLTPIGHNNNTLIMGPGGYRFGDYWRMGLPLEILIILVAVPSILFFWPL